MTSKAGGFGNVTARGSPLATGSGEMPPGASPPDAGLRRGQPATVGGPGELDAARGSRTAGVPGRPAATRGGRPVAEDRRARPECAQERDLRPVRGPGGVGSAAGSVVRRRASASPTIFSQMSQLAPSSPAEAYAIWVPSGEKLPAAGAPLRRELHDGRRGRLGPAQTPERHGRRGQDQDAERRRMRSSDAGIGASQWPRPPAPRPASRTPPSAPAARPSRRPCAGSAGRAPCAGSAG